MDEPENLLLRDRRQTQKKHMVEFPLYEMSRSGNSRETEMGGVVVRGWGRGKSGLLDGNGVFFWGDEKVLELNGGDGGTRL